MKFKKGFYRKMLTLALLAALAIPLVPAISASAANDEIPNYALSEIIDGETVNDERVINGNLLLDEDLYIGESASVVVTGSIGGAGNIYINGGTLTVNNTILGSQNITVSGGTLNVNGNYNLNGNVFLEKNGTFNIGGDFIQTMAMSVGSGNINISGNYYHKSGALDFNGAHITVNGDYRLQSITYKENDVVEYGDSYGVIKMNDANDYFHVKGNFYTNSYWGDGESNNDITNGILELGGNFEQYGSSTAFNAKDNHKVKFSGTGTQTVYFNSPGNSGFNILSSTVNKKVNITQGRINKIGASTTVASFTQYGSLDINKKTFTVTGNLDQRGNINVNKGKLNVNAYYYQQNGVLDLNNGRVTVGKNYRLQTVGKDEKGKTVYDTTYGTVKMNDANDYFLVKGNMFVQSYWGDGANNNDFVDGTLELKGNFYQLNGSSSCFNAQVNHKVIFSGDKVQTVRFDSPKNSGFNIIYATPNTDVNIAAGRINTVGSNVEIKNFNQYGAMDVNGYTINIKEDLNQFGNVNVNSGKLTVAGNYTQQDGVLDLNNGRLEVTGDYRLQGEAKDDNGETAYQTTYGVIKMNDADDYFLVKGNMYVQSYWGDGESNNDLTNGTLELQGDFTQLNGGGSCFNAKGNHKVVFSGDKLQTINFESPNDSGFNILYATPNANVDITSGRINTIGSDVKIKSFTQYGSMDVNGKTLTITGTVNQYGKIYINSGKITVGGYYYQRDGVLDFNNGRLEVGKNYRLQSISKDENNKNVYGTCYGVIKMDDEDDYFLVKGSMFVQSYWGDGESNNDLTNGTLELQGDFTQLNGGGSCFNAKGNHKVVFSGDKLQTINFESPNDSGFNILYATPNANVDITSGRINTIGSDVTIKSFAQYGSLDVNGKKLKVTGNVNQYGNICINSGKMLVSGYYYHQDGVLDFNNGRLEVSKNYRLQSVGKDDNGKTVYGTCYGVIKMNDPKDYFLVKGTCFVQSYWGDSENNNHIVDGTLELKGSFYQYYGSGSCFNAQGNHKVIFSGSSKQTVRFDSPNNSGFNILQSTKNTYVDIVAARINKIGNNTTVYNFVQYGNLDINGKTFKVRANVEQHGNVNVNGGTFNVVKNYRHTDGCLDLNNGTVKVGGSYSLAAINTDSDGNTIYDSSYGTLKMNDSNDYFCVGGSFLTKSYWGSGNNNNDITDGILEISGDFTQLNGGGSNFKAVGNHITVFKGTNEHNIYFSDKGSFFNILIVEGLINDGHIIFNYTNRANYRYFADDDNIYNASRFEEDNIVLGDSTKINFKSYGGSKTYVYAVYCKAPGSNNAVLLKDYDAASEFSFTPDASGYYTFIVDVADGTQKAPVSRTLTLCVQKALENTSTVDSTKVHIEDSLNVSGSAEGGLGEYQYAAAIKKSGASSYTTVSSFASNPDISIRFEETGKYYVRVTVMDSKGHKAYKYFTITVTNELQNRTTISDESVSFGDYGIVYASARGGKAPYKYSVYYKKTSASKWKTLQDGSENAEISLDAIKAAGNYDISVKVTDAAGTSVKQRFNYTVEQPEELENTSTLSETTVLSGDKAVVTLSANGGTAPYKYSVYYKLSSASKWTTLVTDTTDASVELPMTKAGTYDVSVKLTDSQDKVVKSRFVYTIEDDPDIHDA